MKFSDEVSEGNVSRETEQSPPSNAAEEQCRVCKSKLAEWSGVDSNYVQQFCHSCRTTSSLRLVSSWNAHQGGEAEKVGDGDWTEVGPRGRGRRRTDYSGETAEASPALDLKELRAQRNSFLKKATDARGVHNQVSLSLLIFIFLFSGHVRLSGATMPPGPGNSMMLLKLLRRKSRWKCSGLPTRELQVPGERW